MIEIIHEDRPTQLRRLLEVLAEKIDADPGARDLAGLAKQYRDTLKEIELLDDNGPDAIGEVLASRAAKGKPGSVRKSRR